MNAVKKFNTNVTCEILVYSQQKFLATNIFFQSQYLYLP